jgi:hypothetical protein
MDVHGDSAYTGWRAPLLHGKRALRMTLEQPHAEPHPSRG